MKNNHNLSQLMNYEIICAKVLESNKSFILAHYNRRRKMEVTASSNSQNQNIFLSSSLRKTAYISRRHHWFPREMTYEEPA